MQRLEGIYFYEKNKQNFKNKFLSETYLKRGNCGTKITYLFISPKMQAYIQVSVHLFPFQETLGAVWKNWHHFADVGCLVVTPADF